MTADHRPAVRVGLGLAIPAVALLALGRIDLLIFAVFGSFVGMYGRGQTAGVRLRQQVLATGLLGLAVAAGTALPAVGAGPPVIAACAVAYAVAASWLIERLGLRPLGPFFVLFAFCTFATLPLEARRDSEAIAEVGLLVFAATAAFCLGMGQLTRIGVLGPFRSAPVPGSAIPTPPAEAAWRAATYGVAVALAAAVALGFDVGHLGWAAAGAAVPLAAPTFGRRLARGAQCLAGTMVGLAVAAVALLPGWPPVARAVLVIVLMFPTEMFMARNYGLALGFFTPLILLMMSLVEQADPAWLLLDRFVGIVIGAGSGLVVAALFRRAP